MIAVISQAPDTLDVAGFFFVACLGISAIVGVGIFLRGLQLTAMERWQRRRAKHQRLAHYEAEYRDRLAARDPRDSFPLTGQLSRANWAPLVSPAWHEFDREARA